MHFERNLNPPLRKLYVLIGVLLIAYALYGWQVMAGLTVALLIVLGLLFIAGGARGT
jgi:hypothetical protein